jgi:hypothetical protein
MSALVNISAATWVTVRGPLLPRVILPSGLAHNTSNELTLASHSNWAGCASRLGTWAKVPTQS